MFEKRKYFDLNFNKADINPLEDCRNEGMNDKQIEQAEEDAQIDFNDLDNYANSSAKGSSLDNESECADDQSNYGSEQKEKKRNKKQSTPGEPKSSKGNSSKDQALSRIVISLSLVSPLLNQFRLQIPSLKR